MKTPWLVSLQFNLVVMAEDERKARECGQYYANDDGAGADSVCTTRLTSVQQVPHDWVDSIPFGSDIRDERTVRQIISNENTSH